MSKKVYIFLADGFEDIEGLTVVDLMRRAGIDIETVSIKESNEITTSHGIMMKTDRVFTGTDFSDADMLVLPGGMPGTKYLGEYQPLCDLLRDFYGKSGKVAAICAAPSIFGHRGILQGKRACSYPCFEDHLEGAAVTAGPVEIDGNVITSRGMGTSIPFGLAIAGVFCGQNKADACAHSIVFQP